MNKNLVSIVAVIALIVSGVAYFNSGTTSVVKEVVREFGAQVGPEYLEHQTFVGGFSVGGRAYATSSTASTYTLTTTELPNDRRYNYVTWTANLNTTLTTMASSTAPLSSLKVGETYSIDLYSATTTAATTITFAAGAGVDLQELEAGSVVVNGLEGATLKFIKKADSDVILLVSPWQVGD